MTVASIGFVKTNPEKKNRPKDKMLFRSVNFFMTGARRDAAFLWWAIRDNKSNKFDLYGSATQGFAFGTRLHHSSLKTSHCDILFTLRPSQGSSP